MFIYIFSAVIVIFIILIAYALLKYDDRHNADNWFQYPDFTPGIDGNKLYYPVVIFDEDMGGRYTVSGHWIFSKETPEGGYWREACSGEVIRPYAFYRIPDAPWPDRTPHLAE